MCNDLNARNRKQTCPPFVLMGESITLILILFHLQGLNWISDASVTQHLQDFYNQIPNLQMEHYKYKFNRDNQIRQVLGHHSKSALNQCTLKPLKDDPNGFSTICSSPYPRNEIAKLLSDSIFERDYIEINCYKTQAESSPLDDLIGHNDTQYGPVCVCFNLEKYLKQNDDNNTSFDTVISSYDPECANSSVTVTTEYFRGQTQVKVLALAQVPVDTIQPDALHDLTSLEFISFVNNSFGDQDMPQGLFCYNINLKTVHIEGSLLTTFPSQVFQCPSSVTSNESCLHQLTTIVISNTDVRSLPGRLLGCAENVTNLSLTFSSLIDVSTLKTMDYTALKLLDLSHNQISVLHPYVFKGLTNLEHIDLSHNMFTYIESTWFYGLQSLKILLLDNNKINAIIGSLHNVPMTHLSLGFNSLEVLPENNLNGSRTLKWLDLQANYLHDLEPGSLCDLVTLFSLNISANKLSSVGEAGKAFCERSHTLKMLFVHDNNISRIDKMDMAAFSGLEVAVLNDNEISEIHQKAFSVLNSLRVLFLENNIISDIPIGQLSFFKPLEFLHLGGNNITNVHPGVFNGLYYIRTLGLAHNHIEKIEQKTFNTMFYLQMLRLEHNSIKEIDDNAFPNRMTSLNLTDNLFTSPPCMHYTNSLKVLILNLNNISSIHKSSFCTINALVLLQLANNSIESVEPGSFLHAPSLQYLDFTSNRLDLNFSVNYFEGIKVAAYFHFYLNRIRSIENLYLHQPLRMAIGIYIGFNPIQNVPQQPENALYHLPIAIATENLDLSGCNITTIDKDAFVHMVTVKKINLNGNKINYFPDLRFNSIVVYGLVAVEVYENPIECSCAMKWIKERQPVRNIYHFRFCQNPVNQSSALFATLPYSDFVCRTDYLCDKDLCTCYADDIADPPKVANCSLRYSRTLPRILPTTAEVIYMHGNNYHNLFLKNAYPSVSFKATKLTLNSCNITALETDTFDQFRYLEELYLHDNRISSLPEGIFSNLAMLKVLKLNSNLLVELPSNFLASNNIIQGLTLHDNVLTILSDGIRQIINNRYYLKTLSLYENPWVCECDNMTWKSWLLAKREKLEHPGKIMCVNGTSVLATPDDEFLCRNKTIEHIRDIEAFALTTSLAIVLPLFVSVVMATAFYNRHLLAVLVFNLFGLRFKTRKRTEDREFDTILLYDDEPYGEDSVLASLVVPSYEWLSDLDPPFKVMVPDIHILGGTVWAEEICKGINSSHTFLIFLSIDFIKKERTMFLFDFAYHTMMERRSSDIILLIDCKDTIKYIKSNQVTDQRLKAFLRTNNYLLVGERYFYKRLLYLLPGDVKRKLTSDDDAIYEMHNTRF